LGIFLSSSTDPSGASWISSRINSNFFSFTMYVYHCYTALSINESW
jgi:hypothetical protein